jgi:hypothetical protein
VRILRSGAELAGACGVVLAMFVGPPLLVARVGVQLHLSTNAALLLLVPVYGVVFAVFQRYEKAAGANADAAERREWEAARLVVEEEERAAQAAVAEEMRHRPHVKHPAALDLGSLYVAPSPDALTVKSWSPGDRVVVGEPQTSMTNVRTGQSASVELSFPEIDGDRHQGSHRVDWISLGVGLTGASSPLGGFVVLDDGSYWWVSGPDYSTVTWDRWYPAEGE